MSKSWRYLRIIWIAFCGLASILLIVLWVRSYSWHGGFAARTSGVAFISAMSFNGKLVLSRADGGFDGSWELSSQRSEGKRRGALDNDKRPLYSGIGFHTVRFGNGAGIVLPHWFFVLLVALSGTISWLPWRFSLRTLLLALTLVAVVLGFVVYIVR